MTATGALPASAARGSPRRSRFAARYCSAWTAQRAVRAARARWRGLTSPLTPRAARNRRYGTSWILLRPFTEIVLTVVERVSVIAVPAVGTPVHGFSELTC